VLNPNNGKSIVVTVNDRGPFVKGVSLDLARGAARALGMTESAYLCISQEHKTVTSKKFRGPRRALLREAANNQPADGL